MNFFKAIIIFASYTSSVYGDLITYSTGDFLSNEWSSVIDAGSTGTSTATTQSSGGNPDAFRRVSLTVDPSESVTNSQLWDIAVFTPMTQGSISSVSLGYDISRVFTSNAGATNVRKGISVQQDGIVYLHSLGSSTVASPVWEAVSATDILPFFPDIDWVSGNTITFGFYDSVSTSATGFTIDGGYDNFNVGVNFTASTAIPEPSTYLFFLTTIAGLFAVKQRVRR